MRCKPFHLLSDGECTSLLELMSELESPPQYTNVEALRRNLTAPAFAGGRTFLTAWSEEGEALGTVGVVAKEVPVKGEAFLTSLFVRRDRAGIVPYLLARAHDVLAAADAPPATVVRLGLRAALAHLTPAVVEAGFRQCYRLLELRRDSSAVRRTCCEVEFVPVSTENLADYVGVHNAAFLTSPNGGQTSLEEAGEALAEAGDVDLMQIGYLHGIPVLMFELRLQESGWIDALGVHPDHQGRGLGRLGLGQAIATLQSHGAYEVRLQVVDANARAYTLYRNAGFVLDRVASTVFNADLGSLSQLDG